MNLDNHLKKELRKIIECKVRRVPFGKRIKIDNELLEELIFEQDPCGAKGVRVPIWTGKFLSKIDLSELSFDNVNFNANLFRNSRAFFTDTNAIINLDKLFNPGVVNCVDFSGTKVIGNLIASYDSCLVNCGLTAENLVNYKEGELTDFRGNRLNGFSITNIKQLFLNNVSRFSSFKNTGAEVDLEVAASLFEEIKEYEEKCADTITDLSCILAEVNEYYLNLTRLETNIARMILGSKKVSNRVVDDSIKNKRTKRKLCSSIDEQITSFRKCV